MYTSHPSSVLNALFAKKPYQGIAPDQAKFLFVGLDANYGSQIEHESIFPKIHEYHDDGVAFWHKYGIHHPFLLHEYSGDGKFYHRSFAQIGFKPEHANLVSFVELLHLPSVGRNKITIDDLDLHHLNYLNSAILEGSPSHIFLPISVARLMKKTGVFPWLRITSTEKSGQLELLFKGDGKTVYSHLHFSVYGKFLEKKVAQATAIRELLISSAS
jgi:hypothetical protein